MGCQRSTWAQHFDTLAQISTCCQISLAGGPCSTWRISKVKNYGWAANSNLVLERQQGAVFGAYGWIYDMFDRDHTNQTHSCEWKLIPLKHLCFQKCSVFQCQDTLQLIYNFMNCSHLFLLQLKTDWIPKRFSVCKTPSPLVPSCSMHTFVRIPGTLRKPLLSKSSLHDFSARNSSNGISDWTKKILKNHPRTLT